jgi:flagellar biosynthesis/type III secretory pathway protein FliH
LSLKATLEVNQSIDEEDRDLIMRLSPIYEQRLAEAKQEGIQEGIQEGLREGIQEGINAERRKVIENLLQVRFGTLDAELREIIEPLLALSPEEFTPLLLQLSREALLDRFR